MKLISKMSLSLVTVTLLLVVSGGSVMANGGSSGVKPKPIITEDSLGLRKTDLYSEDSTAAEKTEYRHEAPGSSTKIKRAFQDAPPMIPHDVSDYLPITKNNNACIGCHMPDVASSMGATPIPPSHFLDMRPHHKFDGKKFVKVIDNLKNETDVKKINKLSTARYNCSQCHAPQSQGNLAVQNTFEPVYNKKTGPYKSTWDEVIYDDLYTLGKDSNVTEKDIENLNSPAGHLDGGH